MRVLLDENLDHALRKLLGQHDVVTVTYMGWAGLKNGELLQAAEANGFDVFLTGDQTLTHEQNFSGRRLAVAISIFEEPVMNSITCVPDPWRHWIERDNPEAARRVAKVIYHVGYSTVRRTGLNG